MRPFLAMLAYEPKYQKATFRTALFLYLAVLVLGSIPGARVEVGEFATGLVLHALTYSVIAFLLFSGINGSALRKACLSLLIVVAMGTLDELTQSFFPYRTAAIADWFVDIGAGFFTLTLLWAFWPKAAEQPARRS